jgi:hypothetical protein
MEDSTLRNILAFAGPIFTILGIILTVWFGFVDRKINKLNRIESTNFINATTIAEHEKTRIEFKKENIKAIIASSQNEHFSDLEYKSIFLNCSFNSSINSCEIKLVFQNLGNVNISSFSFFVSIFKLEKQEYKFGRVTFELLQDRKHLKPQQDIEYSFTLPNTLKFESYKDFDNHFIVVYGKYFDDLSNESKLIKEFIKLRFDESSNTLKSEFIVGSQLLELETIHEQDKKVYKDKINKIGK